MSRGPHDRQHEEPAVSKSDGTPAVEAGIVPPAVDLRERRLVL